MSNHDFTLKSGAKLHLSTAPFEAAVLLVEAVKKASAGKDPGMDVGDAVLTDPEVRKALYGVFEFITYDNVRVGPGLFDDLKMGERARGDYFEIGAKAIQVNCLPFF